MTFEEFMAWVEAAIINGQVFLTLGGRSQFHAQYDMQHGSITIINSRGKEYILNIEALSIIFERYINAPGENRHRANYYTDPIWPETPSRVAAPYIPAIIKYWDENVG